MKRHPAGNAGVLAPTRRLLPGLIVLALALPASAATGPNGAGATPVRHEGAEVDSPATVAATPFRYVNIAGAAFHPVSSTTNFAYVGAGCINRTGAGTSLFTHKVVLPLGSVVKYLRVYYNDTSSGDILAFFTTYDQLGNYHQHTSVSSVGSSGFGTRLSPEIAYAVDPYVEPVVVTVNMDASTDSTLQFCGVRIAYIDIADDTIFKNGFD